ncbi:MAG: ATP-binding protein [Acidimicrobiia bacterium]
MAAWCGRGTDGLDPDEAQLAKRVSAFLLCGFVAACVQITSMLFAGYWWSSAQLAAYLVLLWIARRLVVREGRLRAAIVVGCAATLALFFASSFLDGQALSPTLWFFGIVPLAAAYTLGTRAGLWWAAVTLACLIAVAVSPALVTVPQEVHQQGVGLVFQQAILLAILMGCAIGARTLSDRQIAQLREREAAVEEASRLKSEFLANMSHEIRTPMNGVLGMIEILSETALDPDQRELAQTASASARMLLRILDDVLDFSKIEAGRLATEAVPFDVRHLVDDVTAMFGPAAEAKGLRLASCVDTSVAEIVVGDPTRIRQVLCNLVANSLKFTESGEVSVVVEAVGGSDLALTVVDTGVGIPAESQGILFDAFRQADGSTTRRYGGTGLGLTISRQLVRLMGGDLAFVSEEGAGSVFTVTLPLPTAEDHDAGPATARHPGADPQRAAVDTVAPLADGLRVLVVEDNVVNRRITVSQLEALGCAVHTACDGGEALDALAEGTFDIVLMDCHMPRVDGFAATRELRRRPGSAVLPVVAVTASVLPDDIVRCRAAGMDDVLAKPFTRAQLHAVMARWTRAAAPG